MSKYIKLPKEIQAAAARSAHSFINGIWQGIEGKRVSHQLQKLKQEIFDLHTARTAEEWFKSSEVNDKIAEQAKEIAYLNEVIQRKATVKK